MTQPVDDDLIDLLAERNGVATEVVLRDGRRLSVLNIACGYEEGDACAYVTTHISPAVPEARVDFFSTTEVAAVVDSVPVTGLALLDPSG